MLIIQRKPGERIVIDGQIVLTFVQHRNGGVVLGVDAPRHIRVDREEIHLRRLENQQRPPLGRSS